MFHRQQSGDVAVGVRPTTRLEPDACVISTTHGDETILLNAATGRYFTLNAVGGQVWTAVCDQEQLATVIDRLQEQYRPQAERIEADVLKLANDLVAHSLAHAAA